jgi:hypothetical protein
MYYILKNTTFTNGYPVEKMKQDMEKQNRGEEWGGDIGTVPS